jgi:Domain of unknown function (DUF4118)
VRGREPSGPTPLLWYLSTTARHNHNANQRAGCWLFCLVLSVWAAAFFVAPPRFSFGIENLCDLLTTFLFVLLTFCSVILIAGMRFGIERYRELNHRMEPNTCSTRRWNNTGAALRRRELRLDTVLGELPHRIRNLISDP